MKRSWVINDICNLIKCIFDYLITEDWLKIFFILLRKAFESFCEVNLVLGLWVKNIIFVKRI